MYHAYKHSPRTPREILATMFHTFGKVSSEFPLLSIDDRWRIVHSRLHTTTATLQKVTALCSESDRRKTWYDYDCPPVPVRIKREV